MAATAKIAEAIKSIPEKKEKLRKAFEALQAHSSLLSSFTLEWKDLEDHLSSIQRSIDERFRALQDELPASAAASEAPSEAAPRPELKALCQNMDGQGLRAFIHDHRKELNSLKPELNPAIRSAPDPAKLVLDAVDCFPSPKPKAGEKDGAAQAHTRTCILLLERLHELSPEMKPGTKERAKTLATQWKGRITEGGDYALEALALLQLLASYRLVSEFKLDDILDLVALVSRRKQTIDLCKSLGLTENMPDLIEKLSNKGKQLDAVKFVYAFELLEKHPPVPLLKAYVKEIKKIAQEVRKKGNNSSQSQNEAIAKEVGALKSVMKAIEEYKLESKYPKESLMKRIVQLEQQKADKKRTATSTAASNSKAQQQHPQQQPSKRPRQSTNTSTASVSSHSIPSLVQTQPQLVLPDRTPYMGVAGSYGLAAAGSLYGHTGPGLSGTNLGLGGSPSRSYLYSSGSIAGSGLYDRPATYGGYPMSGLPSSYNSSLYR